ncbi:MAG: solute carrier family 23 protein [Pseudomonadota bacterium]
MLFNAVKWLLVRPQDYRREKPEEVIYGLDERPPAQALAAVVFQHCLLVLMFMVYAILAAEARGFDNRETISYVSGCLLVLGLGTVLQGLRSRFTPGVPLINIPSPVPIATYAAIIALYGPGAAIGAVMVANLLLVFLVPFLPRLRAYFPPEVIGVVVFMLGLELVSSGVPRSVGLTGGAHFSSDAALIAIATLGGILVASVWGNMRIRILAVLIGTVAGGGLAVALGIFDPSVIDSMSELPLLAMPLSGISIPLPEFVPMAILVYLIVELFEVMDQMAVGLTIDKLNDRNWRRADMPLVSRSVIANCLQNILLGAGGMLSGGSSGANIGLAHASGIMSRHVAIATGCALMVLAFLPAVASLVVLVPEPVVGGILVYSASFMIVAGMELILSRMINMKRTFTVGLSIVVGSSMLIVPRITEQAPEWSHTIVGSALMVGSLCAVALNMLFRIGMKKTASLELSSGHPAAEISDFLEHQGKVWGARREVILRAGMAIGEAMEILEDADLIHGPVTLTVRFDEVDVVCALSYEGRKLNLGQGEQVDLEALLEDDDDSALDAGMMQVSTMMIRRLADRVRSFERKGRANLVLQFEH